MLSVTLQKCIKFFSDTDQWVETSANVMKHYSGALIGMQDFFKNKIKYASFVEKIQIFRNYLYSNRNKYIYWHLKKIWA